MKRMRPSGIYSSDINSFDVFAIPTLVLVVAVLLALLFTGVDVSDTMTDNDAALVHNERAEAFNQKPLEERRLIAEWIEDENIDAESYLMMKEEIKPLTFWARISEKDPGAIPLMAVCFLALLSFVVFMCYWIKKDKVYYLCSLPYNKPYGWVLFFCMFVGWPFLLASFICMCVGNTEHFRKKRELAKREKTAVRKMAEEELIAEARALTRPQFPEKAHRAFVKYAMIGQAEAHALRVKAAKSGVMRAQGNLQKAGESVRVAQQELGKARANLEQLESAQSSQFSRECAEAEWVAIKEARGVSSIKYNQRKKRLEVLIKVRVPYAGELYDFGDYLLVLDGGRRFNCKQVRSGVKSDHLSLAPLYHADGDFFCFGNSSSTIKDYLCQGRYAEAITLVVECMHSVNNDDTERQIPYCFRKVSTVEKAKRKIQLSEKLKNLIGA